METVLNRDKWRQFEKETVRRGDRWKGGQLEEETVGRGDSWERRQKKRQLEGDR